jgi:hypothetical protein
MACRVLARGVSSFKIACRCYDTMPEDLSKSVARHVGTHGAILKKVGDECTVHLREFAQALREAVRHSTPLNVAAYCIGGEKWSVGLVTVLYHCVKGMGAGVNVEPVFPFHTCSEQWHRTCRGNCNMCTNALHSRMSEENTGIADAVQRFNQIYLELLEP